MALVLAIEANGERAAAPQERPVPFDPQRNEEESVLFFGPSNLKRLIAIHEKL